MVHILLFFFVLHVSLLSSSQIVPVAAQQPLLPSFNVTINGSSMHAANNVNNENRQIQNQITQMEMKVEHLFPQFDWAKDFSLTRPCKNFYTFLGQHKGKLALSLFFVGYAWLFYKIKQTEFLFGQHNAWCNWKSTVPLPHLVLTDQKDLIEQLNLEMYKKHTLDSQVFDIANIGITCFAEIQQELAQLNYYVKIHDIVQRLWCGKFFPFTYSQAVIEEKIMRLNFILGGFNCQVQH